MAAQNIRTQDLAKALLSIYDASEDPSDAALFHVVRKLAVELVSRESLELLAQTPAEGLDVRRVIANALFDPGQVVQRLSFPPPQGRGFPEMESLIDWQLRAIETALGPLDDLGARLWREEAWKCYVASGADPDGADARHLNPGEAVAAVKELVEQYDEAIKAVPLALDNTMRVPPQRVERDLLAQLWADDSVRAAVGEGCDLYARIEEVVRGD